jgi:hypothetical protein
MNACTKPHLQVLLSAYELGILPDEERKEVEQHLLECDRCCEDLFSTSSMIRERPSPRKKGNTRTRRKWYQPVVAAAVLILAVSGTFYLVERYSDGRRDYPQIDTSITLISPKGVVSGNQITFRWTSESAFSDYALTLFDERGDSIWAMQTTRTDTTITVGEATTLEPDHIYYWRIVGRREGKDISATPVCLFSIEAE